MGTFNVACGTYDGCVLAMQYTYDTLQKKHPQVLKPLFVDPSAHTESVCSIACQNNLIASGSSDEVIQVST